MIECTVANKDGKSIVFAKRRQLGYPLNIILAIYATRTRDVVKIPERDDYQELIESIMDSQLSDREYDIIMSLFKCMKNCNDIACEYGICSARVSQIRDHAIYKMRSDECLFILENGNSSEFKQSLQIARIPMSTKLRNILLRQTKLGGNIGKLSSYTEEDAMKFVGMGKITMVELKSIMKSLNLQFVNTRNANPAHIYNIECSAHFVSLCSNLNIRDIRQFTGYTRQEIMEVPRVGTVLMQEIDHIMSKFNLNFYDE